MLLLPLSAQLTLVSEGNNADIEGVEAARIAWRPLGRVLVEQGLLTDDELERALVLQQSSGKRLGETIVELGFVSGPDLASALATQYGIELTVETGFGTGLRAQIQQRHENDRRIPGPPALSIVNPAQAEPEGSPDRDDDAQPDAGEAAEALLLTQLEEQWAKLAAAEAALAESAREIERLRQENERLRSGRDQSEEREARAPVPSSHLVFFQLDGGYELVAREGPPPALNTVLELPQFAEDEFVVTRLGHSPLPADARACIFVQRV